MPVKITEGLKKQGQLIKEVINPFLKNNGFLRNGVKYIKKLDYFIIEAAIQRQRYYKDDRIENFRININVYSENAFKLFYGSMTFGGYSIQGEGSWITTDENTDIDKTTLWLNNELDKLPDFIEKYNDVNKVIEYFKESDYGEGVKYAFLLKDNNKTEEFKLWIGKKHKIIEKLDNEIVDLSKQLELLKNENKQSEAEYKNLWKERKTRQIKVEGIKGFLNKINS
jgi:hypothetical protein